MSGRKRTLLIEPTPSQSDKTVHFVEENSEQNKKRNKKLKKKDKDEESDEDPLIQIPFKELMRLNLPDWYLVIPGIIFSAIQGGSFPLMAILFSGILDVSNYLIEYNYQLSGTNVTVVIVMSSVDIM